MINTRHPLYLWFLLLLCLGLSGWQFSKISSIWAQNSLIEDPADISAADDAAHLLFAKAWYLDGKGEYQQALRLYNRAEQRSSPQLLTAVRYNMGVIYLQQAAKLWFSQGVNEYRQVNTLLDLAEQAFRLILHTQPGHWQARYNLEFAIRIRPPAKLEEKADWQGHKSSVHAIMPGIPAGGP